MQCGASSLQRVPEGARLADESPLSEGPRRADQRRSQRTRETDAGDQLISARVRRGDRTGLPVVRHPDVPRRVDLNARVADQAFEAIARRRGDRLAGVGARGQFAAALPQNSERRWGYRRPARGC
jgi:hypothetical protein